jgi:Fur family transcriptional regulator, peroxide stress response regulator
MKELQEYILKNGLKVTPQRLAILKLLKDNQAHPTAEIIHKDLLKEYPAISLKTVYDSLARFVEAEMIKKLDIDRKKMRFDASTNPHDHFYCRICDNVYDINSIEQMDNLKNKKIVDGHHIDSTCINIEGVCRYCEGV